MPPLAASTAVWIFILVPLIVVWAIGVVDILRRDFGRGTKAAWIIIVLVLPVIGTVLYWVLRKPTDEEIRQTYAASQELKGDRPGGVHQRLPDE
jgi:hypothetical protein